MTIRCFIAIELSPAIKKALGEIQDKTKRILPHDLRDIKWVRPEQIHLTLKFLGDTPDNQITPICKAVDLACAGISPFDIELDGLGFFPPKGSARVFWAGLKCLTDELTQLQEKIELALADLGFEPESRDFSPHLTLARINSPAAGQSMRDIPADLLKKAGPKPQLQTVDELIVFQSELTNKGPIYTPLHHSHLE